jgi:DNA-binding transcriptional LysR family regulator
LAQAVIDSRRRFDGAVDERTFTVLASDYVCVTLLHPLLARFRDIAPGVNVDLQPVGMDFADRVRRRQADLAIVPREIAGAPAGLRHQDVFSDRNVCVVDAGRTEVGDRLTAAQLDRFPLLTYEGGSLKTLSTVSPDRRSMHRGLDMSTQSFMVAAFMVAGTSMVALMPSRLADRLAGPAGIRAVRPPQDLPPFTETMYWSARAMSEPSLAWLRARLTEAAEDLGQPVHAGE